MCLCTVYICVCVCVCVMCVCKTGCSVQGETKSHLIINGLLWAQERLILGHVPQYCHFWIRVLPRSHPIKNAVLKETADL